jgi:nuclear transport factor 2 (NTF2) superfamily protein
MHLHTYRRAALLALPRGISTPRTVESRLHQYRSKFLLGRPAIIAFLTRKWPRKLDHRLIKELWAFGDRLIAVVFAYE